uniref:Fibronectin type-III domain-containing protein n=1 Tax=Neogobius melanostomus TaxID=47308 RepID=A0A8C6TGP8_9GOBI
MSVGKTLQMPALGRPFKLGMLYDCREDAIVPGMTLWDPENLKTDTGVQNKPKNEFEIIASESIEDKSSALNVEASLKASFLCGLVEVEGSAQYLNDQKTSKKQARVTLKYNATTRFEELSMKHLGRGNVKHPDVFEKGIATHVVTGILYGAQVMIKKIPTFSIEGKGRLQMEDKDRADIDKFSCKFYGDFNLEKSPVSFTDAVEVYQSLPKLLGANGENAVPVKVWLLPLTALDSTAAKLVRDISVRLVNEAQSVLEDFYDLELRCNDAVKTTTVQIFPQIGKKIKSFKDFCTEFKLEFQKLLAKKLPVIRGGGEEETQLVEILKKRTSSPFNSSNLSDWMEYKEREMGILKSYTKMMKNTTVVQPKQLDEEILNTEKTVCFVFTSLGAKEPYLESLEKYLKEGQDSAASHELEKEQWYCSRDVANAMRLKAKLFNDFAEANKENKNVKFLIMALTDENHKGTCIYLYEGGSFPNENFEPTSKPEKIAVSDIDYNTAILKISPPTFGATNITSYCVEFKADGEEEWHQISVPRPDEVTLKDLDPNTEYRVRCRAVTSVGFSPVYEMETPMKTLPCSAPGKLQVEVTSSEMSVKWEKPAVFGKNAEILGYVVEFAQINKGKDLKWNYKYSAVQRVIISELESETKYAVRVHCDCGFLGEAKIVKKFM